MGARICPSFVEVMRCSMLRVRSSIDAEEVIGMLEEGLEKDLLFDDKTII